MYVCSDEKQLAVFESILASTMDMFKWSRKKACIINGIAMFALSVPCALGYNLLKNVTPFGAGTTILDLEDFIVSQLFLPLGSLIIVLFCVCKKGWGWKNFMAEANEGKGLKVKNFMRGYVTFVLPVIILVMFVVGIYNFFK